MSKTGGKVAKRYAKALFDLCAFGPDNVDSGNAGSGKDVGQLHAIKDALNAVAQTWESHVELRVALLNPATPIGQRLNVVKEQAKLLRAGDSVFSNFLCTLVTNGRLPALPQIADRFGKMVDEFERTLALIITSAFPLDDTEKQEIVGKIRSDLPQNISPHVTVDWKVDRSILGGLLIQSGDKLLDGSLRGSLGQVEKELATTHFNI